jgi:hypothetical protein
MTVYNDFLLHANKAYGANETVYYGTTDNTTSKINQDNVQTVADAVYNSIMNIGDKVKCDESDKSPNMSMKLIYFQNKSNF